MNEFKENLIALGIGIVIFAVVFSLVSILNNLNGDDGSSPVKENEIVDSLKTENTKLVIEITKLDSVKDVKIIEVKNLNNDSTLELFYELIRE